MEIVGSIARNARFASLCCEISKKPRTKRSFCGGLFCEISKKRRTKRSFWKLVLRSFWKLFLWKWSDASRETFVLRACAVKFRRSLARNDLFGSLFFEISRKPRTKRSFWKLFLWKLSEASRETLVLRACAVKFRRSLARNDLFGSLFFEISRKPRTKRSFWKLVLWNFEEASHETIVLEAFSVKMVGSIARNARFASLCCENCRKHRAKRSFWKLVLWNLEEASHETIVADCEIIKVLIKKWLKNTLFQLLAGSWFWRLLFPYFPTKVQQCFLFAFSLCFLSVCSLCVFSVFSVRFLSVFSVCVFCLWVFLSAFSLCVFFSLCIFCLCVFSLCVFSLCVLSVFLSVFSVCLFSLCFLSVCFLSVCLLSVCFLCVFFPVFSLCVFCLCVFSLCVLAVFSLCVFVCVSYQDSPFTALPKTIHF